MCMLLLGYLVVDEDDELGEMGEEEEDEEADEDSGTYDVIICVF